MQSSESLVCSIHGLKRSIYLAYLALGGTLAPPKKHSHYVFTTFRYSYPFFGCPYPVVVQPPVQLSTNTDQTFSQSYCAFEFATEPEQLIQQISANPLVVEVWQSCDKSHDLIIGTAKVK